MNEDRCSQEVRDVGRWPSYHPCQRKATVTRNKKRYCKIHDPKYVAAKRKAEDEAYASSQKLDHLTDDLATAAAEIVRTVLVEPFSGLPKPVRGAREAYWRIEADLNAAKGKAK